MHTAIGDNPIENFHMGSHIVSHMDYHMVSHIRSYMNPCSYIIGKFFNKGTHTLTHSGFYINEKLFNKEPVYGFM